MQITDNKYLCFDGYQPCSQLCFELKANVIGTKLILPPYQAVELLYRKLII